MGSLHPAAAAGLVDVVTRRLSLRRLNRDDVDGLVTIFADADVWRFEYDRGLTRGETTSFLDRQMKLWNDYGFGGCGVRELATAELIGVVGMAVPTVLQDQLPPVTVGWRFAPTAWGKGFATESATAVLDQAFTTMGLERVGCVTGAENQRSVALAERLGMRFIGTATVQRDDGASARAALYEIGRDDWPHESSAKV
jgi:RimJ/RimL family protein N-acetyltransferase